MGETGFGAALHWLEAGEKVSRKAWHGRVLGHEMWITVQWPDENSKMGHPYIYMKVADGKFIPWVPSHTDIFAGDWEVVDAV